MADNAWSLRTNFRPINILLIEEDSGYSRLLEALLLDMEGVPFLLRRAGSLNEGFDYLAENDIDVILMDLNLPDSKGVGTFRRIHGLAPEIPIVVITSFESEETSLKVIREGAQDYIFKSELRPSLLMRSLLYAIERKGWEEYIKIARLEAENRAKERTTELAKLNQELTRRIQEQEQINEMRKGLIVKYQQARSKTKSLSGTVRICSSCKSIKDDQGTWVQMEEFVGEHFGASPAHGICPTCVVREYPAHDKGEVVNAVGK